MGNQPSTPPKISLVSFMITRKPQLDTSITVFETASQAVAAFNHHCEKNLEGDVDKLLEYYNNDNDKAMAEYDRQSRDHKLVIDKEMTVMELRIIKYTFPHFNADGVCVYY